jgi:O-antigen/teichoic acid export membrane protein
VFAAGAAIFRFLTRIAREGERAALDLPRYAIAESAYLVLGFAAGATLLLAFDLGPAAPFAGLLISGAVVFLFDAPRLLAQANGGMPSYARAGAYASYGTPLALALAVDLGVQALARIIVAQQADPAALGAYAAAFGLARPIDLIFMSAGAALTPLILAAYEHESIDAAKRTASNAFATMAAIALPAALGLILLAQPLTTLMVGHALAGEAGRALPWLAAAGLFSGFNLYYWSEAFQLTRRTGLRALIMLAPGVVQIALTLWLAGSHGAAGAAIAAAAGAACGTLLLAAIGSRLFAPPLPLGTLARIALACAAMAVALSAMPPAHNAITLASAVAAGVASYGAAAFALDLFGARARTSAVWQALAPKLREVFHTSFTERFHARR